MVTGPSREFLTTEAINMLIAQVAQSHVQGGPWAIEKVERPSEAEAIVTYVIGTHPNAYGLRTDDERPRIVIRVEVHQP